MQRFIIASLAVVILPLVGCGDPGHANGFQFPALGLGGSSTQFSTGATMDKHVFQSTTHMPMTVVLMDTFTRRPVWELKIPVNHKAVVQFKHGAVWTAGLTGSDPPTEFRWGVFETNSEIAPGGLQNVQKLPGNPVLIQMFRRANAESPNGDCCPQGT